VLDEATLRIACMGTRGIPAHYGGFETFYENLAPRLVDRGHDVTVYTRPWSVGRHRRHAGARLIPLPSIRTKHLDTISHTSLSVLHGLTQRFDVVLICGPGNAPLAWVPRLARTSVVLNVDGSDSKRAKWGRLASSDLRAAERLSASLATVIVADNRAVQQRFRSDYGVDAIFIPYGANIGRTESRAVLDRLGLEARRYILWVGRLERETRVEELIEAYQGLDDTALKLVIVGDAPFADAYRARLREMSGPDVIFAGYAFGDDYAQLSSHAFAYVQTSPTSGTSPALLDQMGFGNAVIGRGTATIREVIDEAGLVFDPDDAVSSLAETMRRLLDDPALVGRLRAASVERVRTAYSWDSVTDAYESLFYRLADRSRRRHPM
jgi:glycosyltransferase involved in cell wall biosynthesis